MKRYYFIDKQIYYQGKKMPDRKVELFNVRTNGIKVFANDIDGNAYYLDKSELIIETK